MSLLLNFAKDILDLQEEMAEDKKALIDQACMTAKDFINIYYENQMLTPKLKVLQGCQIIVQNRKMFGVLIFYNSVLVTDWKLSKITNVFVQIAQMFSPN